MSHELRTPLNGVIGFTRQMLKTGLSTNQRDYMSTIERSANNLLSIINDVLDFSKLEAGKLVLESIPFRCAPRWMKRWCCWRRPRMRKASRSPCASGNRCRIM